MRKKRALGRRSQGTTDLELELEARVASMARHVRVLLGALLGHAAMVGKTGEGDAEKVPLGPYTNKPEAEQIKNQGLPRNCERSAASCLRRADGLRITHLQPRVPGAPCYLISGCWRGRFVLPVMCEWRCTQYE